MAKRSDRRPIRLFNRSSRRLADSGTHCLGVMLRKLVAVVRSVKGYISLTKAFRPSRLLETLSPTDYVDVPQTPSSALHPTLGLRLVFSLSPKCGSQA